MRLSIRNQLPGTVTSVDQGGVLSVVKVELDGGQHMTASITNDAVSDLGLGPGSKVTVLVTSTEVSLAVE